MMSGNGLCAPCENPLCLLCLKILPQGTRRFFHKVHKINQQYPGLERLRTVDFALRTLPQGTRRFFHKVHKINHQYPGLERLRTADFALRTLPQGTQRFFHKVHKINHQYPGLERLRTADFALRTFCYFSKTTFTPKMPRRTGSMITSPGFVSG